MRFFFWKVNFYFSFYSETSGGHSYVFTGAAYGGCLDYWWRTCWSQSV